jgi:hypothetical protein
LFTGGVAISLRKGSMLHELKALIGSHLIATDGGIGSISTFLFDDQSWKVRYLVVDVGGWMKRREVVLAVTSLKQPDWANRTFHVTLTRQQIQDSPDLDAKKPVTLQQKIAMRKYWGPLAYWADTAIGGSTVPAETEYPLQSEEDPHLRSTWDLLTYEVWATDGEIGHLEGFVVDDSPWHLGFLDVKAGGWLEERSVRIPTRWVSLFHGALAAFT